MYIVSPDMPAEFLLMCEEIVREAGIPLPVLYYVRLLEDIVARYYPHLTGSAIRFRAKSAMRRLCYGDEPRLFITSFGRVGHLVHHAGTLEEEGWWYPVPSRTKKRGGKP